MNYQCIKHEFNIIMVRTGQVGQVRSGGTSQVRWDKSGHAGQSQVSWDKSGQVGRKGQVGQVRSDGTSQVRWDKSGQVGQVRLIFGQVRLVNIRTG